MSTHKHIDKICVVAIVISLIISVLFMSGSALGIQAIDKTMGYEERLFSTDKVHTIDIIIDDWDTFISTAQSEEYSVCSVVIDGEAINNVGIRGKGNSSLSTVSSMDSERYSFKIEFDQYDSTKNYHGLDKLSLNNLIQDNTYMKDYLTYQMMNEFGVDTPLCSYAYITINGEDWGLYLALEAIEESFLQRNYGSNYGDLYKPDSMNFCGGRGNGMDFDISDFMNQQEDTNTGTETTDQSKPNFPGGKMQMPDNFTKPSENKSSEEYANPGEITPPSSANGFSNSFSLDEETFRTVFEDLGLDTSLLDNIDFNNITINTIQTVLSELDEETIQSVMQAVMNSGHMQMPNTGDVGVFGGIGSSDVKLQYIDDDPDSYSNIFASAKTSVTDADQNRLISSLKQLSEYENLEKVINMDEVLRYFVIHNFVVNDDSYTGAMIHNYYLYEEDGQLSMIPWDYNLAFGTFTSGNASSSVNKAIDEVLEDRPMQAWIFSDESYSQQYYALYEEMLEQIDITGIIENAYALIASYVKKDPTAFCSYDEFVTGVDTLQEFCSLRIESIHRQLSGNTEKVDTSDLNISDMGTMGNTMRFGGRGDFSGMNFNNRENATDTDSAGLSTRNSSEFVPFGDDSTSTSMPKDMQILGNMELPKGMKLPEGVQMPNNNTNQESGDSTESSTGDVTSDTDTTDDTNQFENFSPSGEMPGFASTENFGNMMATGHSSVSLGITIILVIISVVTLAAGLLIAFKFKH